MDIGSILLILAAALLAGVFISRPFFDRKLAAQPMLVRKVEEQEHLRSTLMAERDRILTALQELDFDFAVGKIPTEDYPVQRAALLQKGADVLRELDGGAAPVQSAETRLEAAVAARRADARLRPAGGDDDLEQLIAARRRERQEKAVGFCPRCGAALQKSDRFCAKCGAVLEVE